MQEHVGVLQLLQCGLEGLDEVGGQLADEADGVGDEGLLRLVELEAAGGRVKGVEQAVVCGDIGACEGVQQRGFAGVV